MQHEIAVEHGSTVLYLISDLIFSDRADFARLLPSLVEGGGGTITVDLSRLRFLDSAGLGMLLSLRDAAGTRGRGVALRGAGGNVLALLRKAKFDTLFPILDGDA